MDRIQIFDQLVPFNKPANKAFSSILGLSYKVVCCQNFAFLNRYHTLCEGRNSIKYITIPQLEVDLFASSQWQKEWQEKNILHSREYLLYTFIALKEMVVEFWTSPMELFSDSILDKKNDKKKTYFIVENTCYIPL